MATLRELADITGYSIATISRVLNEDDTLKVTDHTRNLILEAAGRVAYPNRYNIERKADVKEHLKLGVVEMATPRESEKDPYYLYFKNNLEKCCFSNGVETFAMQYDARERCYRSAANRELDGILAIGQFCEEQIEAMRRCTSQIVFLESSPFPEEFCSVIPDYEVGVRQGVDYLIAQGHRKIVFVGPEFSTDSTCRQVPEPRRKCFSEYLSQCGEDMDGILINTESQGADVTENIIEYVRGFKEEEERPTAFFAYNEPTALGVLRALQIAGYQVPQDFSIMSYNDTVLATVTRPQLSGIRIHIEEMVKNAVWLMDRINRGQDEIPLKILVPSTLVIRESVKPVYPF